MKSHRLPLQPLLLAALLLIAGCVQPTSAPPARKPAAAQPQPDAFVMLSGGASPMANNYSQYLQAKAVAKFFRANYPGDRVWTFFGAGNVEGEAPVFADVRRQYKKDGLVLESWVSGPLPFNRPAKREVLLKAFREEILPVVSGGGTLYLFVGDHGSTDTTNGHDTTIDLWGIEPDPAGARKWKSVRTEKFTAADLREVLAAGLGKGRVVFCMTQCYSGGFHFMGIPRHVTPNPAWFAGAIPAWAQPADQGELPAAAGYSATDHYSLAAGCDPDPDPDKWAGYERFVPENLLGLDLFTLAPAGMRRDSFHAAHIEATLVDKTIDKPHATSERYLERWATAIEKLAAEKNLKPAIRKAVAAYQQAVDRGQPRLRGAEMLERQQLFATFTTRLAAQAPSAATKLTTGTRAELEALAGKPPPSADFIVPVSPRPADAGNASGPPNPRSAATAESRKLWNEVVRPAWSEAVAAGTVPELAGDAHAAAFERTLLAEEANGRNLMFASGWQDPLLAHVFWESAAPDAANHDPVRAESISRWGAIRRRTITAWAKGSDQPAIKEAAEKIFPPRRRPRPAPASGDAPRPTPPNPSAAASASERPMQPKIAAERVLFYRRVLAAWAFLDRVGEKAALRKVRELTALERTPLPPS